MIDGNANKKVEYNYDSLGRLESKNINLATNDYLTTYTFKDGQGGTTTTQLEEIDNDGSSINYQYNSNGNITSITENNQTRSYQYDELNQLVRENNQVFNKTITYTYDVGGNITAKTEYPYTTGTPGTLTDTTNYSYGDSNWDDKLTSYDGKAITYDQIGNPLTYDGYTYTWEEGRRLKSIVKTGLDMSFKYNADGIRTEKTVNGTTTSYHLLGDKVTFETNGIDEIYYTYDSNSSLISMNLNDSEYYYIRNGQGDIIGLHDNIGTQVVSYTYDTWGKIISIDGTLASTVGEKNPYRYRGYRYESETGLYYLQSRYYNAEWGRFINADGQLNPGLGLSGMNMYSYCGNNPVNASDPSGHAFMLLTAAIGAVTGAIVGGVIAAVKGKSIVKGALIGAAVGGLVGLGAGATAGALLAGSATASTAAVLGTASLKLAATGTAIGSTGSRMLNKVSNGIPIC